MRLSVNIVVVLGIVFSYSSHGADVKKNDKRIALKDFDLSLVENKGIKNKNSNADFVQHYDHRLKQQTFIWSGKTKTFAGAQQALLPASKPLLPVNKWVPGISDVDLAKSYLQHYIPVREKAISKTQAGTQTYAVSNNVSNKFGPSIVKFRQKYNGVDVFAREANVLMDKDKNLVAVSGYLAQSKPSKNKSVQNKVSDSAAEAIHIAFKDMGLRSIVVFNDKKSTKNDPFKHYEASTTNEFYEVVGTPRVKKVWYELDDELISAHYVEVGAKDRSDSAEQYRYAYVIADVPSSEKDTKILFRKNQIQQESYHYRTFADSDRGNAPFRGPLKNPYPVVGMTPEESVLNVPLDYISDSHQLMTIEHGPISTMDPWLPDGATETVGNNVDAYVDITVDNGRTENDFRADITAPNTFDWIYDPQYPASTSSRKAAIVNLFYMNNWLHDYFYDFGFDEAAGNAQANNYDRGGLGNDVLLAEGQDYGGRSNANMFTPADGASPVMQMYVFSGFYERGESFDLEVTQPEGISLSNIRLANVGPGEFSELSGKLVPVVEECIAPSNAQEIEGHIALVKQSGLCPTTVSVKVAQDAGAKAVIVSGLSSAPRIYRVDSGIEIPSMSISADDASLLNTLIDEGSDISIRMYRDYLPDRDGTLANGIVAHEWGHYLTNRLVGNGSGLTSQQGRGMGEGWGDFLAIYFAIEEEHRNIPGNELFQGLYSSGGWADPSVYYGIRRVPYSTDMKYNAVTFKHIDSAVPFEFDHPVAGTGNNAAVHATGEFWANTLLEVYVSLLNDSKRLSFKEAKERMAYYLVTGLKLTPIAPTFTEARDGILAAAYATDRKDYDVMIGAFAKRGLGIKAISPDRSDSSNTGATNNFDTQAAAFSIQSSRIEIEKSLSDLDVVTLTDPTFSSSIQKNEKWFCPKDGILDMFELGELIVDVKNVGNLVLNDLVAKVSSNAGFSLYFANFGFANIEKMEPYSDIATIRIPFILLHATTAEEIDINIEFPQLDENIDYPKIETLKLTVNYDLATDTGRTADDLENSLTAKKDWVVQVDYPIAGAANYQTILNSTFTLDGGVNDETYSNGQMWSALDNSTQSDVSLTSPVLSISDTESFSFSFEHAHDFESGSWDGAVIEVKVDDGKWVDVLEAGAIVSGYAYNGIITENGDQPLSGRTAFVNTQLELNKTSVDFTNTLAGKSVQLRLRMGSDAVIGAPGWLIDNLSFTGIDNAPFSKVVPNKLWCFN